MHRLLALGCVLALGCAGTTTSPPAEPVAFVPEPAVAAPVDAGPPGCEALTARLRRSDDAEAATWLDAPLRMAEGRRLRALEARAARLGCLPPRG